MPPKAALLAALRVAPKLGRASLVRHAPTRDAQPSPLDLRRFAEATDSFFEVTLPSNSH